MSLVSSNIIMGGLNMLLSIKQNITFRYYPVYRTLVACLHVWLDTYPEDFRQPPHHPALQQLLAFTQLHLPGSELHSKVAFAYFSYLIIMYKTFPKI